MDFVFSFDLLFFGVGVFVEKRPKRILMWNRTHAHTQTHTLAGGNNQEMFTAASENSVARVSFNWLSSFNK